MRRIHRGILSLDARHTLYSLQLKADDDATAARSLWANYRQSARARPVVAKLRLMAGPRDRCFYCSDSRAVDIDHFDPITRHPSLAFVWSNMLWVCVNCNRRKASKSVRAPDEVTAALLDPTQVDPWAHFVFIGTTGLLAPRFAEDTYDGLAQSTLDILPPLNDEAVALGRFNAARRLREAAGEAVTNPAKRRDLLRAVSDDDYGVARWYGQFEGRRESPFPELRVAQPTLWRRFVCASS